MDFGSNSTKRVIVAQKQEQAVLIFARFARHPRRSDINSISSVISHVMCQVESQIELLKDKWTTLLTIPTISRLKVVRLH